MAATAKQLLDWICCCDCGWKKWLFGSEEELCIDSSVSSQSQYQSTTTIAKPANSVTSVSIQGLRNYSSIWIPLIASHLLFSSNSA